MLDQLERIDTQLDAFGLRHFRLFNTAYTIVTRRIQYALDEGYFHDPKLIEEFVRVFADYYFNAVHDCTTHTLVAASPWAAMNNYADIKSPPVFLSLLIGASAHINHDLPLALAEVMRGKSGDRQLSEIATLNKILMASGKEITDSFREMNPVYDFLKRRLSWTYYRPAMYTIFYWRIMAWKNYKALQRDKAAITAIEQRSMIIAKRLLRISRLTSRDLF